MWFLGVQSVILLSLQLWKKSYSKKLGTLFPTAPGSGRALLMLKKKKQIKHSEMLLYKPFLLDEWPILKAEKRIIQTYN